MCNAEEAVTMCCSRCQHSRPPDTRCVVIFRFKLHRLTLEQRSAGLVKQFGVSLPDQRARRDAEHFRRRGIRLTYPVTTSARRARVRDPARERRLFENGLGLTKFFLGHLASLLQVRGQRVHRGAKCADFTTLQGDIGAMRESSGGQTPRVGDQGLQRCAERA